MSEDQQSQAVDDPLDDTDVASMEDILASIRSMIAEDTTQSPAPAPVESFAKATPPLPIEPEGFDDLDSLIEPIDFTIPDAELSDPEPVAAASLDSVPTPAAEPIAADELAGLDLESLFEPLDVADTVPLEVVADLSPAPVAEIETEIADKPVEFDMSALDYSSVDTVTPELQTPRPSPTVAEVPVAPQALSDPEDMELVKSLMADLTETDETELSSSLTDDVESALDLSEDWFTEDLSIPEIEPAIETDSVAEANILDEILDQSLADEEALRVPSDVEVEITETVETSIEIKAEDEPSLIAPVAGAGLAAASVVSLADIAARAEEEAGQLDGTLQIPEPEPVPEPLDDMLAEDDFEIVAEIPTQTPEPPIEAVADEDLAQALEEEVMARTAPLEEILADEVEADTSSAFAELNRLVEEKSIVEERGPRIGDLVQEALKPMLKEWLDENLKSIVERAVQKEVKRISSRK